MAKPIHDEVYSCQRQFMTKSIHLRFAQASLRSTSFRASGISSASRGAFI